MQVTPRTYALKNYKDKGLASWQKITSSNGVSRETERSN